MHENKTIILTGGGTGGHIYPNLALTAQLSPFCRVCYVGNGGSMEERLCKESGIEFFPLSAPKFQRKITLENAKLPFALATSVKKGKQLIKQLSPCVIFSKGGYASLPICLSALSLGVPVLCHESDLSVGLANKIVHKKGGTLLTSFKPTMQNKKRVIHVGTPIRKELTLQNKECNLQNKEFTLQNKECNLQNKEFTLQSKEKSNANPPIQLLVVGGSQGAKTINQSIVKNLENLTANHSITHITGVGKLTPQSEIKNSLSHLSQVEITRVLKNYHQVEYATDMASLYQNADIAISRGGANALFELLQFEIPTLVIPLEKSSRGDQVENAEYFAKIKLCHTISESNMFALCESLATLQKNACKIKQNIKEYKSHSSFDGRDNIIKLLLSHC